ncbi:MAG: magnesium transporter CorA family protein [Clostridiales bacterium]|nr:magnesium transporter CorA family protein [Clostridiales bacterium]
MITILKTVNGMQQTLDVPEKGCWIHLTAPTIDEILEISKVTNTDAEMLKTALDDEERARIEFEENTTLIIVDIPYVLVDGKTTVYNTLPLGIVQNEDYIITVTLVESPLIMMFLDQKIKDFYTNKKTRFVFQLLYRNAAMYLRYLRNIDQSSNTLHGEMQKSYRNKELFKLMALEKSLVYFSTSLKGNEIVMEKLMKVNFIKKYPDDEELLDDVIIENKQAIEMCSIYRDILSGMMDAYASIISNNLSIVMKFLATITIVISLPTLVTSAWGMNVNVPWSDTPTGFIIVSSIAIGVTVLAAFWLWKRKMF